MHSDKNVVIVNTLSKRVGYLSPTYRGKTHDKKVADSEQINYPKGAILRKDTGFQGYEPDVQQTHQPKKTGGKELTPGEKRKSRALARVRVRVEHAIAGIKRSRCVKDTLRNTRSGCADGFMEVATSLHNLRIRHRKRGLRR